MRLGTRKRRKFPAVFNKAARKTAPMEQTFQLTTFANTMRKSTNPHPSLIPYQLSDTTVFCQY
jgi:hypothetical protein